MDDKKLNELLNQALASLTGEQKAKAKACKTAKELIDFLAEAGVELPDEVLDMVAGGEQGAAGDMNICPKGGSHEVIPINGICKCNKCGHFFLQYYKPSVLE